MMAWQKNKPAREKEKANLPDAHAPQAGLRQN
jgi:hypothetical protein